jgi:ribosomal protein S18 acetylase RimI-like enzyme
VNTQKLNQQDDEIAQQICGLFLQAYEVEAQILGVDDFPPLHRTALMISNSNSLFYGIYLEKELAAAIEIEMFSGGRANIASMGVSPKFFRRGLGTALLRGVLPALNAVSVTVSTGKVNQPALRLYQNAGFVVAKEWVAQPDIQMLSLIKIMSGKNE